MKVYLKCDKNYNGKSSQIVDGSWVRSNILQEIILLYAREDKNNNLVICVTEEVIDYYNKSVGGNSCKSAQSIAKNLRVRWLQKFADGLIRDVRCKRCGALLQLNSDYKEFTGCEEWLECLKCGEIYDLEGNIIEEEE